MAPNVREAAFRAFGSDCRIVADLDDAALTAIIERAEDLEARWSRFRPDSEVSRCNARAGEPIPVSSITAALFERANQAVDRTGGRFNPLLLNDLIRAGYDRSFDELEDGHARDPLPGPGPTDDDAVIADTIGTVSIEGDGVRVPAGTAFDPGGIGKGLAADLLLADLLDRGARWAWISLGGDLCLGGDALAEQGVSLGVGNPWRPDTAAGEVTVHGGGVATSSVLRRRWTVDGDERHHLIDPATRKPARSARVAVTMHAREAWWADVIAKCSLIDDTVLADTVSGWGCAGVAWRQDATLDLLGWELG